MKKFIAFLIALSWPTLAAAQWHEAQSRHFVINASASPAELRRYAERLERFDAAVRLLTGRADPEIGPRQRLRIFVLPSQESLSRMIGISYAAGVYLPRVSGATAFVPKMNKFDQDPEALSAEAVFFHEYLHHLMQQEMNVAYPHWVREGFAELFATARIEDDGTVTVGAVPAYRAYSLRYPSFPFEQMLAADYAKLDKSEIESVYATGWLTAHYLTFGKARPGQLRRYIAGIGQGLSPLEAARAAFGDLKQFRREIDNYRIKRRMNALRLGPSSLPNARVQIRPLGAGEAAIMPIIIRSTSGVDAKEAARVVADARRIASRFPADPVVQLALAEAEYDSRSFAAAAAAADRALAAHPDNINALIYRGMAMAALAKATPGRGDWKGARANYVRAYRLDSENAWPLLLYYRSFLEAGEPPPPNAVDGLRRAYAIYPGDDDLRLLLVRQLLQDKELQDARRAMLVLAHNPHGGGQRDKAVRVIEKIDAGNAALALAELEGMVTKPEEPKPRTD